MPATRLRSKPHHRESVQGFEIFIDSRGELGIQRSDPLFTHGQLVLDHDYIVCCLYDCYFQLGHNKVEEVMPMTKIISSLVKQARPTPIACRKTVP